MCSMVVTQWIFQHVGTIPFTRFQSYVNFIKKTSNGSNFCFVFLFKSVIYHNLAAHWLLYLELCCSLCLRHGELVVELLLSSSSSSSSSRSVQLFRLFCCRSTSSVRSLWSWFCRKKQTNTRCRLWISFPSSARWTRNKAWTDSPTWTLQIASIQLRPWVALLAWKV